MKSRRFRKSRGGNFSLASLGSAASTALLPGGLFLAQQALSRRRKSKSKSRFSRRR